MNKSVGRIASVLLSSCVFLAGCEKIGLVEPPITITFRQGVLSKYVAQVSNLSTKEGLEIYLYVANEAISARSGNMVIPANSSKEIGALEFNWLFNAGDRGFVRPVKYNKKLFFEIAADGQYKTWFGFNDIPEVDVAAELRAKKEAEHKARLDSVTRMNAKYGRELFFAMMTANVERNGVGLSAVWPKSQSGLTERAKDAAEKLKSKIADRFKRKGSRDSGEKDIANLKFGNSTDYLNVLLDCCRNGTDIWHPYIVLSNGMDAVSISSSKGQKAITAENNRWSILADYDGELSDCVPVIVSANFPCEKLRSAWDGKESSDEVISLCPSGDMRNEAFVAVYKDGSAKMIDASQATLNNIYPGSFNTCTNGYNRALRYLTPHGVKNAIDVRK